MNLLVSFIYFLSFFLVQEIKGEQIFRSLQDLSDEYSKLQNSPTDSVSLEEDYQNILLGKIVSKFEDFLHSNPAGHYIDNPLPGPSHQAGLTNTNISSDPRNSDFQPKSMAVEPPPTPVLRESGSPASELPGYSSVFSSDQFDVPQSSLVEFLECLVESPASLPVIVFSSDEEFSPSSEAEDDGVNVPKDVNEMKHFGDQKSSESAGKATQYDKRFKLILETFNNIGEIMLFKESELVVTDPRKFTEGLVKNIMDHNILNETDPDKPQEINDVLYKGIFSKNSFKGEDVDKYWTLLQATGLGVQLTPLAMFIPLLIMEQTKEEIETAALNFRTGLDENRFRFACKYQVANITGNGIEFFHELTKV